MGAPARIGLGSGRQVEKNVSMPPESSLQRKNLGGPKRQGKGRSRFIGNALSIAPVVSVVSDEYCSASVIHAFSGRLGVVDRPALTPRRWRTGAVALWVCLGLGLAPGAIFRSSAQAQSRPADQPAQAAPDQSALNPYDGRPVRDIRFEGLSRVSDRFVRNQLRIAQGQAFESATVTADIHRLYSLYEFETVEASVEPHDDGSVTVVYTFREAPIVQDVQVVGNHNLNDEDLAAEVARVNLVAGVPMDRFRIDRARRAIEELYNSKGYDTVQVTVDETELETGVVLFRIREGERVRLMATRFEGARSFSEKRLRQNVRTKTRTLLNAGALDEESLDNDVTALIRFYISQGYLDVRVDRRLDIAPNSKEAIATFIIDEGPRYRLRTVRVERSDGADTPLLLTAEQVVGLIATKPGDAYTNNAGAQAVSAVLHAYNKLGYVDANVQRQELRDPDQPFVDLTLGIEEGKRFRVGEVIVQGNTVSKQSVIRRQLRLWPDRPLDVQSIGQSQLRLQQTRLFARPSAQRPSGGAKITMQPEDPLAPGYRDVLVQIEDANTGSITFLAAVSADSGLIGQISVTERNFDIGNPPRRLGDLFTRRRFRGAGQTLNLTLSPGTVIQNYVISFSDPSLLETDISMSVGGSFRNRFFDDFDEERLRASFSVGRRFGDRWVARLGFRGDRVRLTNIDPDAPVDAFAVNSFNTIYAADIGLTRTTVPPTQRLFPTTGSRTEFNVEQVIGDFTFTKLHIQHQFFLPVSQDALGRTSVASLKVSSSWIPQNGQAPIYERFFLGGSTFRGFDFRGVSPRGIANNTGATSRNPNGGQFSFFAGLEYVHPLLQEVISLVGFLDTGTVEADLGFTDYRVSAGVGLRIKVPALGPVPLAFDFAIPLRKATGDQLRFFSFTADIPF